MIRVLLRDRLVRRLLQRFTIRNRSRLSTATATSSATVSDANTLTAVGTSIAATATATFTGTVATFTDSFTGASAAVFTATINWGDGSSSTGTVTGSPEHSPSAVRTSTPRWVPTR